MHLEARELLKLSQVDSIRFVLVIDVILILQ